MKGGCFNFSNDMILNSPSKAFVSQNQPCAKLKPHPVGSTSSSAVIQLICRTTPVPENALIQVSCWVHCTDFEFQNISLQKNVLPNCVQYMGWPNAKRCSLLWAITMHWSNCSPRVWSSFWSDVKLLLHLSDPPLPCSKLDAKLLPSWPTSTSSSPFSSCS